jgi:hypothetical protein
MEEQSRTELLGYVELRVGSLAVQVPLRAAGVGLSPSREPYANPFTPAPLATFEVEGDSGVIFVHGEPSDEAVEKAIHEAALVAAKHLSRKLLN